MRNRLLPYVAAAALGVIGACGSGDEPTTTAPPTETMTPSSSPQTTSVATTSAPPAETTAPTSTAASTSPPTTAPAAPTELDDWIAGQLSDGATNTDILDGAGTTARLLISWDTGGVTSGAVLFDDGALTEVPDVGSYGSFVLFGLGDGLVLVARDRTEIYAWAMSADRSGWSPIDLGFDAVSGQSGMQAALLGDSVVVAYEVWELEPSTDMYIPGAGQGAVIAPDLTVTPMTRPAERIPLMWTVTTQDHALLMGIDAGADTNEPLEQPWAYDIVSNNWSLVPVPDWIECGDDHPCGWHAPHEGGDLALEVSTGSGVVKRVPDGTIGLYDPATATWTRLDDAPFDLSGPYTASVGRYVAVAPISGYDHPEQFGTLGSLDIEAGTWTTFEIEVPPELENGASFWHWEMRANDELAMVTPVANDGTMDDAPAAVLDGSTGEWRLPTDADAETWQRLARTVPTADLADYA